ncbi:flavo protein [Obba rivulosa]|uniref:Flavo protein n=1 Tax=Obba rivulosa TaxID=1052685 RepID=A0A8E2J700_9APHY|nr:flavo protein [Obba rivulosa]
MSKIALLIGSSRNGGNGAGLGSWLTVIVSARLNGRSTAVHPNAAKKYEVVTVDPAVPPHPLGPILDGARVPAQIRDPALYASPAIQEWSRFVTSCDGFIVLSPEYNGSYPGELKNAFDHLFWEWRNKPALIVTYGGGGGTRCAAQLKDLLGRAFKMSLATSVGISLSKEYTDGQQRVPMGGHFPDFLSAYVPQIYEAVDELKNIIENRK